MTPTTPPTVAATRNSCSPISSSNFPATSLEAVLLRLSASIDKLEKRFVNTDSDSLSELEWKKVSLVVDRVLLLVFFLAMTIASLAILTSSPHIYTTSLSDLRESGQLNLSSDSEVYEYQKPCRRGL